MWPPPNPPPCPPPPPPPPRACAAVASRLPASTALAKIIITRPLMTFSIGMGGLFRRGSGQTPRVSRQDKRRRRDELEIGVLAVASTKFYFNQPAPVIGPGTDLL